MNYIAFDSHKRYTLASVEAMSGSPPREARIEHERGAIRAFLEGFEPGSPVAIETMGNWYWIVDEIEAAGMQPRLVHALKAKLMMGQINKTDKLDARGMNRLQRTGALPTVWIPPGPVRDQRELPRTRMTLTGERTRLKNRILATLAKYGLTLEGPSDAFGAKGRTAISRALAQLPEHTRYAEERMLEQLDKVVEQIGLLERRMHETFDKTPELESVMSLPGIGFILGTVIVTEVGDIHRFPTAGHYASYAGVTPRVHSSGGKTRFGRLRSDVNHYLKWAYVEAGNTVSMLRRRWPEKHACQLYERVRARKGHQTAVGAVGRHLAEATFWMLTRNEPYREPAKREKAVSSTKG